MHLASSDIGKKMLLFWGVAFLWLALVVFCQEYFFLETKFIRQKFPWGLFKKQQNGQ